MECGPVEPEALDRDHHIQRAPFQGYAHRSAGDARSYGDDDFSSGVSLFQITDGLWDLVERVRLTDDRRYLSGLDEFLEHDQVLAVLLRDERAQPLAHERGQHERPELAIDASEPSSAPFASDDDEGPPGGEGSPEV